MAETLADYDFEYPAELIAQEPLSERGASRMLVLSRANGEIHHRYFRELTKFLTPKDLVVVNDTSVIACRLFARKPSGGKVEVFLLRSIFPQEWSVFFSPARGLTEGMRLPIFSRLDAATLGPEVTVVSLKPEDFRIRFDSAEEERKALAGFGEMPLPPYIARPAPREEDRERYQTVFAKKSGAVAAPTAGLHFTPELQTALQKMGVGWSTVTLHVGAGTFLPVKTEKIEDHAMHSEYFEVPTATVEAIASCKARGGRILAVGTTSLRALESWALSDELVGETDLFIRPGFPFRIVDLLLTNFHQPKSTLLMLVSALAGRELILRAYREAIDKKYRLFSYGDCMLIC